MMRALILDPFSGVSGDMFLAALIDLGVPFDALLSQLTRVPELSRVAARSEEARRGVFKATRVVVTVPHEHVHRSLSVIRELIEGADLKPAVKAGAVRTFTRLAEAEAKVHGQRVEDVHFHEVGALDSIFDIVGAHVALDLLGSPKVFTRPLALGSGRVKGEHGEIPIPAPATLELLAGLSTLFTDVAEELVTPTGAAIVASVCEGMSADRMMVPERIGYGAGSRDREGLPNVLRAILGEVSEAPRHVCILTSTIDDMNPQLYGFLMEKLFQAGALEVYYSSIMMKKNRPGIEVTVIGEEHQAHALANVLMTQTTTLGLRLHREERVELLRRKERVGTPYGPIEVKVAERPGGVESMSPEYESCKEAAEKAGVGIAEVYDAAKAAWESRKGARKHEA